MTKNKKVAILLVLFNEELHIVRLAKSIINQTYKDISVYAIDNNSSDSSASLLLKYLPYANIIISKENLGFAKGNNIIADKAINNNEDLLFILNTDTEIDRDCISNLVEVISDKDDVVGVGPILYYGTNEGRTKDIQSYADNVNFTNARTRTLYTGSNLSFEKLPESKYVNTLHGGCFLIRSSIVSKIGLFNEDNFMYNDEIDLAYRINKYGGKLLVSKNAIIWHYHDWTKNNKMSYYLQYYYINRNRILFFYRYKKYLSIISEILIDLFLLPVKIFWAKKTVGLKLLKYYYLGYWHGLLNKQGKAEIEFK
jgi:GT2 family glycosyltransferase